MKKFWWRLRYTVTMCDLLGFDATNWAFAWGCSAAGWEDNGDESPVDTVHSEISYWYD